VWCLSEVVFLPFALADERGVLIHSVPAVVHCSVGGVEASTGHVDQVVPVPIEAGDGAMIDIDEEGLEWLLRGG